MNFPSPPAFDAAMDDEALRGSPLRVYLYLTRTLDFVSWRAKKLSEIEAGAHVHERSAAWALDRLRESGYIERGSKIDRVWTYRLVWSIAPRASITKAG